MDSIKVSAIDLFCGVGGLTHGLIQSGIPVRMGLDLDSSCKFAFEENNQADFIAEDITNIKGDFLKAYWDKEGIKILVGCAPCQPFSSHANKINNEQKTSDKKWNLINEYLRIVGEAQPDIISMENVPNLINKEIFRDFVKGLEKLGYYVSYSNVFCPEYGLPQSRKRLVLLGSKFGEININKPTHNKGNYLTVKDVIGGLDKIEAGATSKKDKVHSARKLTPLNLQRIKASKPNGTWLDWHEAIRLDCHKKESGSTYKSVYGRMSWDEPSPTITTQFTNYGTGRFGHPEQNRALSLREGALLQTFPKEYKFIDDKTEFSSTKIGRHIGNAVPVALGKVIGLSILNHIKGIYKNGQIQI